MTAERTTNGHSTIALREIGRWTGGGTPSKSNAKFWINGTIPWVSPKDMKVLRLKETEDHITDDAVANSATNIVRKGSVLIVVRSGILRHSLPVAVADRDVALNQDLKAVELTEAFDPDYVAWALRAAARDILHTCAKAGTTVQNLEIPRFLNYRIRSAPLEEQQRIVAEIEKQFTRLDAGLASLKRIQTALKRYHASVLKAACDGRLAPTEAELARKENRSYETGEQLLQRLLKERREKWNGKGTYKEPPPIESSDLPTAPEGWTWVRFDLLGDDPFNTVQTGPFGAQLHNTEFIDKGMPVIAVGNLTGTGFTDTGLYFVSPSKAEQLRRYDVWSGDVLFARSGATLGKVCVAPDHVQDWRMTGHILRARLNRTVILPEIAVFALAALPAVRRQVFGNVRGVTRPGFNTALLESIRLPLPPVAEQKRIVPEVERRLSVIEELETVTSTELQRATRLRGAILARAFRG